jgi:peptidoglycan/xylan/chitin deacetylase (PgdA/CDA1 family)
VLDELERCRARATFFVLGERAEAMPGVVRAAVDAGHEVQLHGYRHLRHSQLTEEEIELDTRAALDALAQGGVRPTRWRTPWGITTPASERVASRHGLALVHWTIDTHDWRGDPALAMLACARRQLAPGAVVLMHDGLGPGAMRSGCENTVELLAPLIAAARARGLAPGAAVPTMSDRSVQSASAARSSSREHGAPQPLGAPQ